MKKVITSLLIVVSAIVMYLSISKGVEDMARQQNNFNLDSIVYCVENELVNRVKTPNLLTSALNSCAKGQRSMGITGDVFVIRKSDKKLFWDASQDCKPESELKLFMTEKGICSLFKQPESCLKATAYMLNNPPKGTLSWYFDDSEEYIDYKYLNIKVQNEEYIIGQGSQKDEASQMFNMSYIVLIISTFILLVMTA
jgi:hypothetical protein